MIIAHSSRIIRLYSIVLHYYFAWTFLTRSFYAVVLFFLLVMVLSLDAETARVVVFRSVDARLLVPRAVVFFATVVRVAVFLSGVVASVLFFIAAGVVAGSVTAAFFLVGARRGVPGSAAVVSPSVSAVAVFLRVVRGVFACPLC
jgi:hypothetical protein